MKIIQLRLTYTTHVFLPDLGLSLVICRPQENDIHLFESTNTIKNPYKFKLRKFTP